MINLKNTFNKTLKGFKELIPMLLGILLLISMIKGLGLFSYIGNYLDGSFFSVVIADIFGSISVGNAINSYIVANSFGDINNHILIITAFLISWITVGFVQIPAEISFFGKRFTIIRNIISFIFAIVSAYMVYLLMKL